MTDIAEQMRQLKEDTWTKGNMLDTRTNRTCLVGRYVMCAGLNLYDIDLIDTLNASDYLLELHKVIAEQYPEVVDEWLGHPDDCHELDVVGLITLFNDRAVTGFADIQKVTGKI